MKSRSEEVEGRQDAATCGFSATSRQGYGRLGRIHGLLLAGWVEVGHAEEAVPAPVEKLDGAGEAIERGCPGTEATVPRNRRFGLIHELPRMDEEHDRCAHDSEQQVSHGWGGS